MIGARLILETGVTLRESFSGPPRPAAGEGLSRKGIEELQIKDLQAF
jgi:hypothetical protein